MISKNKIKFIHSLEQKKLRKKEGLFIAEGPKIIGELLQTMHCTWLAHTPEFTVPNSLAYPIDEVDECSYEELKKASFLTTPQEVIGTFALPDGKEDSTPISKELCLALDGIQDPGNLGTIIRLADWFGIKNIYCSLQTADAYSPKTVQATMGAISRVKLYYTDLASLIDKLPSETPIYGTLLDGDNIYNQKLENKGLLVMGNEGNGVKEEIADMCDEAIYIPMNKECESLNVGIATSIILYEFSKK